VRGPTPGSEILLGCQKPTSPWELGSLGLTKTSGTESQNDFPLGIRRGARLFVLQGLFGQGGRQMGNALYIRTSTVDQDGAAQLHALRRAAETRGWQNVQEFIDIGHSGAKTSRPRLDALKKAVQAGEVKMLMVFGLDRLGRSLRDLLVLLDQFAASGCALVSLRESIDMTTPTGRLLVHVIAALAEFERELIRDRVRSGLARVKATGRTRSGKAIGRPKRKVDGKMVEAMRQQGRSWRQISQALKVPRRTLVRTLEAAQNPG
jgi:DNA invertase Pin-like site-specific DNA recombinase